MLIHRMLHSRVLQRFSKVFDCLLDSFLELDLRFPVENFFRAADIWLAHFRVVHWQWLMFDCRSRPSYADDFIGELFDRHLARVADVDRLMKIAHREPENSVD